MSASLWVVRGSALKSFSALKGRLSTVPVRSTLTGQLRHDSIALLFQCYANSIVEASPVLYYG